MSADMIFLRATIDAWAINAKREKEAAKPINGMASDSVQCTEWGGQEIAFKRVQDLLTKAGIV